MTSKNFKISLIFITAIILTLGLSISLQSLLAAYTAPLANPATCLTGDPGCDAPLNIGSLLQTKSGALWINTDGISPYGLIVETGNVGIGNTGPSYKLDVSGDTRATGAAYAASFNCTSDIKLKKDINIIDNALLKLNSINGVYYKWKDEIKDKDRQVGVIAQDVEKVLPEIIKTNADGYKTVDYSKLSPLLIEAVKELDKENKILKEQIKDLQLKVERLEK